MTHGLLVLTAHRRLVLTTHRLLLAYGMTSEWLGADRLLASHITGPLGFRSTHVARTNVGEGVGIVVPAFSRTPHSVWLVGHDECEVVSCKNGMKCRCWMLVDCLLRAVGDIAREACLYPSAVGACERDERITHSIDTG